MAYSGERNSYDLGIFMVTNSCKQVLIDMPRVANTLRGKKYNDFVKPHYILTNFGTQIPK